MKRKDATTIPELVAWLDGVNPAEGERLVITDHAVKPLTVYLDSTIVGHLTEEAWRQKLHGHLLYVSDITLTESGFAMLHTNDQTRALATRIHKECRLPENAFDDAHHVAVATIHRMKVLLTLNVVHLANAKMIPLIERACEACRCAAPLIVTPEQLAEIETGR
jgi:hypothetical protein